MLRPFPLGWSITEDDYQNKKQKNKIASNSTDYPAGCGATGGPCKCCRWVWAAPHWAKVSSYSLPDSRSEPVPGRVNRSLDIMIELSAFIYIRFPGQLLGDVIQA